MGIIGEIRRATPGDLLLKSPCLSIDLAGALDRHGMLTLAAGSTTQPFHRVLPLTLTFEKCIVSYHTPRFVEERENRAVTSNLLNLTVLDHK
jgi:hypothetical protein